MLKYLVLTITIALFGCSKDEGLSPITKEEAKLPDPDQTGTLSGFILFEGKIPKPKAVNMTYECKHLHKGATPTNESLLVSADSKIQNAFIYIKKGLEKWTYPTHESVAVIDQDRCIFTPRITGAMTRQKIKFTSKDPIAHNVKIVLDDNSTFDNFTFYNQGLSKTKQFASECIMAKLICNLHSFMIGYIGIVENPFYAVTGPDGHYKFENLPEGKYELEVWHETLGRKTKTIEIKAKEIKTVDFTLKY